MPAHRIPEPDFRFFAFIGNEYYSPPAVKHNWKFIND